MWSVVGEGGRETRIARCISLPQAQVLKQHGKQAENKSGNNVVPRSKHSTRVQHSSIARSIYNSMSSLRLQCYYTSAHTIPVLMAHTDCVLDGRSTPHLQYNNAPNAEGPTCSYLSPPRPHRTTNHTTSPRSGSTHAPGPGQRQIAAYVERCHWQGHLTASSSPSSLSCPSSSAPSSSC